MDASFVSIGTFERFRDMYVDFVIIFYSCLCDWSSYGCIVSDKICDKFYVGKYFFYVEFCDIGGYLGAFKARVFFGAITVYVILRIDNNWDFVLFFVLA